MKKSYDPVNAYLDGFYSWATLAVVVVGILAGLGLGAVMLREVVRSMP